MHEHTNNQCPECNGWQKCRCSFPNKKVTRNVCYKCKQKTENMKPFRKHLKMLKESNGYSWNYMRAVIGAIRGVVDQNYNPAEKQLHLELLPGTVKQLVFNEIEAIIGATIQNDKNNTKIELAVGDKPTDDIHVGDPESMEMVHTVLGSDLIDSVLVTWTDVSENNDGFTGLDPDEEFLGLGGDGLPVEGPVQYMQLEN